MSAAIGTAAASRVHLEVRGAVQGVGFRPFAYRLAAELGLGGSVSNTPEGAALDVEGSPAAVDAFVARLEREIPPPARVARVLREERPPRGDRGFSIAPSLGSGARRAVVLPDVAMCPDCRREIFDRSDRRFAYPFTSCARCGPRYSILERLPFDRENTAMKGFPLCGRCRAEYGDPSNRRFHAQTIACPDCGPRLAAWDAEGCVIAEREAALAAACAEIRHGRVVAVKGVGGFLLICDARNERAVRTLRERKERGSKPFALLAGTIERIRRHAVVSDEEERVLLSPEAPIVILRSRASGGVAPSVAPGLATLGFMLPASPLHELLCAELGFPVVATSGNRSEEPLCIDEREAIERLDVLADLFLVHDRPILRRADDSVVRLALGRPLVLRRARGYAPTLVELPSAGAASLAFGGQMKSAVAASDGRRVLLSPHIGTLETTFSIETFRETIHGLAGLFEHEPAVAACDLHPGYASTRAAEESGLPLRRVQHHLAHVLSCAADNGLAGPVLGVAWDGTGWGPDGTVWGGEFLRVDETLWERVAHLRTFPLPGGDRAIREPRRAALGLLHALLGEAAFLGRDVATLRAFSPVELAAIAGMLRRGLNAPSTSSAGRLFDAVASIVGLRQRCDHEGEAAVLLEEAARRHAARGDYLFELRGGMLDWGPMARAILADARGGRPAGAIAAEFHEAAAAAIVLVARSAGIERVALSGGCFQNVLLLERAVARLRAAGFQPFWHRDLPPNDGGLAVGQALAAARGLREGA